ILMPDGRAGTGVDETLAMPRDDGLGRERRVQQGGCLARGERDRLGVAQPRRGGGLVRGAGRHPHHRAGAGAPRDPLPLRAAAGAWCGVPNDTRTTWRPPPPRATPSHCALGRATAAAACDPGTATPPPLRRVASRAGVSPTSVTTSTVGTEDAGASPGTTGA